jgi:hypothetical protein
MYKVLCELWQGHSVLVYVYIRVYQQVYGRVLRQ